MLDSRYVQLGARGPTERDRQLVIVLYVTELGARGVMQLGTWPTAVDMAGSRCDILDAMLQLRGGSGSQGDSK